MTHVNVTIHGRQYRMACEEGQEDHLRRLAKDLDQRIEQLQGEFRRDRRHAADRDGGAYRRRRGSHEAAKRVRRLEEGN